MRAGLFSIALAGALLACQTVAVPTITARPSDAAVPGGGTQGECPTTATEDRKGVGAACTCDMECATGTCSGGACCAGIACSALVTLGGACNKPSQCQSGFCADGVCCNVACTGACVACNTPGRPGECTPIAAGAEDKHGVCRRDPASTCGQSGYCNGLGGCAKYRPDTPCRLAGCLGKDQQMPEGLCDGEGTCVQGKPISCAPSICEDGACRGKCTGPEHCQASVACVDGSCGPKGLGQSCLTGAECDSGFCVDGACCESACAGRCTFCASPEARGRCLPVKAGALDPRGAHAAGDPGQSCLDEGPSGCGANGRCDGQGGCQQYPDGTVCRDPQCNEAGNTGVGAGICRAGSCQLPKARSCAPFQGCSGNQCRTSCANDEQCTPGKRCEAGDCGKRPSGALCSRDGDCTSEICAQGRCCSSVCDGVCQSCALPGLEGTCLDVPAGGTDPTGSCRDDVCTRGCDGAGGCRREPAGTTCGAASCGLLNRLTTRTCSAAGVCETRAVSCPLGSLCLGDRCIGAAEGDLGDRCVDDSDCRANHCVGGTCCSEDCPGCFECSGPNFTCQVTPAICTVPCRCGDGLTIPTCGETCDTNCPSSCAPVGCRLRRLRGSPDRCNVECMEVGMQTLCQHGDGCCPNRCNASNDNDCSP